MLRSLSFALRFSLSFPENSSRAIPFWESSRLLAWGGSQVTRKMTFKLCNWAGERVGEGFELLTGLNLPK